MAAFTHAELAYLRGQPLMRFASASPTGMPGRGCRGPGIPQLERREVAS